MFSHSVFSDYLLSVHACFCFPTALYAGVWLSKEESVVVGSKGRRRRTQSFNVQDLAPDTRLNIAQFAHRDHAHLIVSKIIRTLHFAVLLLLLLIIIAVIIIIVIIVIIITIIITIIIDIMVIITAALVLICVFNIGVTVEVSLYGKNLKRFQSLEV